MQLHFCNFCYYWSATTSVLPHNHHTMQLLGLWDTSSLLIVDISNLYRFEHIFSWNARTPCFGRGTGISTPYSTTRPFSNFSQFYRLVKASFVSGRQYFPPRPHTFAHGNSDTILRNHPVSRHLLGQRHKHGVELVGAHASCSVWNPEISECFEAYWLNVLQVYCCRVRRSQLFHCRCMPGS
jgi:hypothetical protein